MFSILAPSLRRLLLVPMLVALSACGDDASLGSIQPTPQPTVLVVNFSGILGRNSAYTHPFPVTDAGLVSVFLLTSSDARNPESNAIPIGISLGTWSSASGTCSIVAANDSSTPGTTTSTISAQATAAGNLCVRVYDVGFVPVAANYELQVDHY